MSAASSSNQTPTAFHRFAERLVFGNRPVVLILFALITAVLTFFASQLRVDAGFKKQIPRDHEYMQTFLQYEQDFGGANRVLLAVVAKDGNMFTQPFFQTMEKVTADVIAIEETDDARVRSIFTPNVRFVEVVEDGFAGGNVIPPEFTPNLEGWTATEDDFATVRGNIVKAGIVGRLVSKDFSGAMVWADLIPEDSGKKLDYQSVAAQFEAIRQKYENDQVTVHIIGFAKMVGDIADGARSVVGFFFLTIGMTWLLLFLYSTSGKLASLTVLAALISVVWMLGALRLMGFGIDPMNMLTPFLIFAIAVSHGEQMINRFRGEIFFGGLGGRFRRRTACSRQGCRRALGSGARSSFRMLLIPGTVALLAGCIGFGAILVIPIDHGARAGDYRDRRRVALTILTDLVLLPVLLSYTHLRNLDRKREYRLRQLTQFDRIWAFLAKGSRPIPAVILVAAAAALWFFAEREGDKVMTGDAQAGVAELWPDARYNRDAEMISSKFALGVDILNVIAEAGPSACTDQLSGNGID
jgi:predicted RND superfamily exporter protein